jgi:hypothetical protein
MAICEFGNSGYTAWVKDADKRDTFSVLRPGHSLTTRLIMSALLNVLLAFQSQNGISFSRCVHFTVDDQFQRIQSSNRNFIG